MSVISDIINEEGGFVHRASEQGGPTNFGVTLLVYSSYLGRQADVGELRALTMDTAAEIYERIYLSGPRIHLIDQPLQDLLLDMSIRHSPLDALKMLQRVINGAGFGPISLDGKFGPETRKAIESAQIAMGDVLINALVAERIRYIKLKYPREPSLKGRLAQAERFKI